MDDGMVSIACPGEVPSGAKVIARVRRQRDGSVKLVAVEDLPGLRKGERVLLELGAESVALDATTTLAVEFPSAELVA
jgi:hypothetical protein